MYQVIVGTIIFSRDENWKEEADIVDHKLTFLADTYEEAAEVAEELLSKGVGDSYVIPQAFPGRIYNTTDKRIYLHGLFAIEARSKVEWAKIQEGLYAEVQD